MTIPHLGSDIIEAMEITNRYGNVFFNYLNKFIDSYRLMSGRDKIRNFWTFNEFLMPIRVANSDDINRGEQLITWSFLNEPLVLKKPLRTEEEHTLLEKYLSEELPLYEQFLLDARREYLFNNYLHSCLNSVIALEIVVSDYIRSYANIKGIEHSAIKEFIKSVGLTGNIKTTLKLISPNNIKLPPDDIFDNCKKAITTRNNIVHRGLRKIEAKELNRNLKSVQILINYLIAHIIQ
jgi:hypothetical protein